MSDHPAQSVKYFIVPYTRGNGIEVGGGQLYPHFRAPGEMEAHDSLDFVFTSTEPTEGWETLLKMGGHLVSVDQGHLRIQQMTADGLADILDTVPDNAVCVVRYGGFGDSIQAANILPELKRLGYHVVFMTTPRGQEILKHDPHIDAFLLQDDDQVPNQELPLYWMAQAPRFAKFINLSESVEGTLLAFPGRANHQWPDAVRRRELGKNYLEWTAQLAELPYTSEARFYPSDAERATAAAYLADFKNELFLKTLDKPPVAAQRAPDRFNILWCLSGSSMHKFYPHQDDVIASVLKSIPEAVIVFSGDAACALLEQGWENQSRIRRESGRMGIRDTLTLAQQVDLVVGPETGILNAVAFEPMAKVIMLSHSSPENLSKHWVNTTTMTPANTPCYPCHRLHYGSEFCHPDVETGAAACQKDIAPDRMFVAIMAHYRDWQQMRQLKVAA